MKLYEIEYVQTFDNRVKRSFYQIPADDEWNACLKFGQTYSNKDDKYDMKVVSVIKVRN